MKFYNRQKELVYLEKILKSTIKSSQLLVIYGRRRIGKTRLIDEFLKIHKGINFFVEQKDEKLLLEELEEKIRILAPKLPPVFKTFDDFLEYLFNYLGKLNEPIIFVFDEIQNFNKTVPGLFSKFQKYWDKYHVDSHIMLVCVGSIIGMVKKIFQDQKEPLFSRAQHSINLKKFDIYETSEILKELGVRKSENILRVYGITDGIPKYLQYLEIFWQGDIKKFINDLFLFDIAPLKEEVKNILVQEFGSIHGGYFSILECISRGKRVPVEIANKTSIPLNTVNKYLHDLTLYYEIITKTYPITEDPFKSRNVRYFLRDNLFGFWFRFIYSSLISEEKIIGDFDQYLGTIFEDVCAEFVRKTGYNKVGRWWNKDIEIDVLGIDKNKILIGECKWSKNPIDIGLYYKLLEKERYIPIRAEKTEYALFSRTGFTKRLIELSEEENIQLYDLNDILMVK